MASASVEESDEDLNYYQLLGVEQDASNEAIMQAFRRLSKEKHPDKNLDDSERATRDFQKLAHAKIILLDAEKRRRHDEDLIDSGIRNEKALPLFCSICSRSSGRHARRCLKGFGHKSPLIEEYHAAQREYQARRYSEKNKRRGKAKFIQCLERVLEEFTKNEFPKLYPLAKSPNRKQQAASNEDFPLPRFVNDALKRCYLSMRDETSEETGAPSMPTASEVSNLLEACQLQPTRRRETTNLPSTNKFPMYDLSILSDNELRLILDYLRLPYETSANREVLENMAYHYCPMVVLLPNLNNHSLNRSKECGRCSSRLSFTHFYFTKATSTVCFSCNNVCCSNCLVGTKWKIPSSGSFDLRTICSECFRILKMYESQNWLERGIALLGSDQSMAKTVLAMYRISNAVHPSDVAIIHQAKVLYAEEEYTTLAEFGKEILLDESWLTKDNRTVLLYFVTESLLKVIGAMPETNLMSKVELCEDTIDWIERLDKLVDEKIHNLKLTAIRMRLALFRKRDGIIKKKAAMALSQLTQAIKEGSFLNALLVIQDEGEDSDEVMHLCWLKLLEESNKNYNEYSRLLLRLFKAIAQHEQGNSTAAIIEVADVFWSGYELFQSQDRSIPIVDYVVQFTLKLILNEESLPLENVAGINVSNFLSTLQLTEESLTNPPDIDDRQWGNLTVEGCDMKMFLKYETAVKKLVEKKKWMPLDAAFAYHDLLTACQHPAQLLLTIITSAQWFMRQISCSDSSGSCLFACKKMITKLTNLAAALAFEFSTHPYLRYYVAKLVIGLQFYSSWKTGHEGQETANFIGVHMKWLVATGRHCPLHKMPTVTPTEAVLMNIISTKLHCEYLLKLQDAIPPELRPMSEAILRYQIYENCWFKRGDIVDPTEGGLRLTSMAALLAEKKWSWGEVQRRLVSNMIALDRNGWQIVNGKLMDAVASSRIQRLVGLEINKKDFGIKVLVEQSSRSNVFNRQPALLSWGDIAGGLSLSQAGAFFSLEAVDPQETPYHPFNKLIYSPEQLEGTEMLFTMLHTDYLLKQFSMGHEIQSHPPFQLRPVSEGLLKDVPDELKEALCSIPSRGASRNRVHRLWIQADTMQYDVQETGDTVRWLFGEVKITVRCMPMFHGEDGELKDLDTDGPDPDSPEGRFVEDFTKNYEKIGKYFPAFLRLKELCKVQWLGQFLDGLKDGMEDHKKRVESGELDSEIRRVQASALQQAEASIASNLDKVRNDIKREVSYINDNVVSQVHRQSAISASYSEISHWLYTGNSRYIAKKIACENAPSLSEIRRRTVEHQKESLRKYKNAIADLRKSSKTFLSASNKCKWIPAVNHSQDEDQFTRYHYGGVSLIPKAVKTNLSTPGFFSGCSKVSLTPGLLSNHAPKKQQPPPAFNPRIVNATKPSTGVQQTSANTRNVQASGKDGRGSGGPSGSGAGGGGDGRNGGSGGSGGNRGGGGGSSGSGGGSGEGGGSGGGRSGGRSGGDSWENAKRKLQKALGVTMGTQIREDKKSPKARQYVKPLSPGKSDWETALSEFILATGKDAKARAGKTAVQGSGWDSLESSRQKIERGEKPPRDFSLVHSVTVDGQKWSVILRSSSKDKRPTLEYYRKGIKGKMAEKRFKIRVGDEHRE